MDFNAKFEEINIVRGVGRGESSGIALWEQPHWLGGGGWGGVVFCSNVVFCATVSYLLRRMK